jgi:hypothetical protein
MDWNLAIERNHWALKRIVAMLVAMAGQAGLASPLAGFEARSSGRASGSTVGREGRGDCEAIGVPGNMHETSGERVPTLPRHLHRAILRLLRPAESAVRRLVIVMARGLTLSPPRPRKPAPAPAFLSISGGTGILMPRGSMPGARPNSSNQQPRTLALPLFDPLRPFRPRLRRPAANGTPRISLPGVTQPFPVVPRRPPASDDPLNATRLALRLQALGAALDDLPGQARRFARWRAARAASRDAAGAQVKNPDAAGAQGRKQRARRIWPLRPGRPPGQRPASRRTHEVYEILHDLHGLAFDVLERPDTS